MKKKSILAMAMVFGLVGSTAFPVQAADTNCSDKQKEAKRYIVVGGKVSDLSEIKNVLEDLNDKLQNSNWKDCPTITLPDCDSSDNNNNKPNIPDTGNPDNSQPDEGSLNGIIKVLYDYPVTMEDFYIFPKDYSWLLVHCDDGECMFKVWN